MSSITEIERFGYHASVLFALEVDSDGSFPLILECTVRSYSKKQIDLGVQSIERPGKVLVHLIAPAETAMKGMSSVVWTGDVVFTIWPDANKNEELENTGWLKWQANYVLDSNPAQDAEVRQKYAGCQKITFKQEE